MTTSELANMSVGLWYGPSDFTGRPEEIPDTIRTKQLYAAALIWLHMLLCILSIFVELVPGYALGGGVAGVTWSSLPHGVWQVPNFFVLFYAMQALYFDSNQDMRTAVTHQSVAMWLVLVACPINIVHITALGFNIGNTNSTFWLQNTGAWVWVILIGVALFIVLGPLIAWRIYSFYKDVENAHLNFGWMPGQMPSGPATSAPAPPSYDYGPAFAQDDGTAAPPPPANDIERRFSATGSKRFKSAGAAPTMSSIPSSAPVRGQISVPFVRVGSAVVTGKKG
jgi:hypothetical protein